MEGQALLNNVNTYYGLTCYSSLVGTNSTMVVIGLQAGSCSWLLAKSLNAIQIITDGGCLFQYRFQIKHLKYSKTFNQRPFKRFTRWKNIVASKSFS
jgi:hypothetical protein